MKNKREIIDFTGKKSGFLTAINPIGRIKNKTWWLFKCDCGKIIQKPHSEVFRDKKYRPTQSCGCRKSQLMRERRLLPNFQSLINRAFQAHKAAAKQRNLDSKLTIDEYSLIIKKPCRYCDGFSLRKRQRTNQECYLNSVDRLNNESYYNLENSVPCCFVCQRMKGSLTEHDFLEKCVKIYKKVANATP